MSGEIQGVFSGQTAHIAIAGTGPVTVSISIYGPGGAVGYNPPGTVSLDYYDPSRGMSVHEMVPIGGGYTASVVTVTTGSIIRTENWMGEIRVTPIDSFDGTVVSSPAEGWGKSTPGWLRSVLGTVNAIDDGVSGVYGVPGYYVGIIESQVALNGGIHLNTTYAPGYLTSLGIDPAKLPPDLEAQYDSSGNFIGLQKVDHCFPAGTRISMWDGTKKPIEQVEAGDIVTSYDKDGTLKPGRVKRTMTNRSRQILDVHGLMVTPGHATLCGDGRFDGQHVPILDILRSDGALVREDGSKIRAGTGCALCTIGDRMITAIIGEQQPDGLVRIAEVGQIRAGTRFILDDGEDVSVLDMILNTGGHLTDDGMIQTSTNGPKMPFRWTFTSSLPKPEDYVLQRSATHLQDIYQANEWESVRPSMPIPMGGEAGATLSRHPALVAAAPVNVPLALRNRPDAPKMSRKYRRAAEAKVRKKGASFH